jgi:sterol desaturase/sphingolipid hydroxylase (fatty acid hydroxylase superfamily)
MYGLILFGYYLLPAGLTYLLFHVIKKDKWESKRIQDRRPKKTSVIREIRSSLIAIVLFALYTTILCFFIDIGKTKVYTNFSDHSTIYFIFSILIFIIVQDAYFYWTHRFMHLKRIFPYVHRSHHLSNPPTPFATLNFGPWETIIEFGIYPIMIFLVPLHPYAIGIFLIYNVTINTAGHIGFEIVPRSWFHHTLLKHGLTVTHHEMHHSKVNCNYGIYFTFWDRIMGTTHRDYEKTYMNVKDKSLQPKEIKQKQTVLLN